MNLHDENKNSHLWTKMRLLEKCANLMFVNWLGDGIALGTDIFHTNVLPWILAVHVWGQGHCTLITHDVDNVIPKIINFKYFLDMKENAYNILEAAIFIGHGNDPLTMSKPLWWVNFRIMCVFL